MHLKKKENVQRIRNCHRGSPLPIRRFLCVAKRGDEGKEDVKIKIKKLGRPHTIERRMQERIKRETPLLGEEAEEWDDKSESMRLLKRGTSAQLRVR